MENQTGKDPHVIIVHPEFGVGVEVIGRHKIYRDPNMPVDQILVGWKSKIVWDRGIVYAPWRPVITATYLNNVRYQSPKQKAVAMTLRLFGRKIVPKYI